MISLYFSIIFLYLFGLLNIFGLRPGLIINELLFAVIGIVVFLFIKKTGRQFFKNNAHLFYWIFVISLVVTYIIGFEARGSKRWIDLFFFNFQGSEFFKIFFILFLSEFLAKEHKNIKSVTLYFISFFYFIIPTLIIFKQPDLGNAMVFLFIYLTMVLFSRLPKRFFLYTVGGIAGILPFGWLFFKQYQKDRILSFFNPHLDRQGTAYNMIQSIITIGAGGLFGHGLGKGTQSKLLFLPENHTDFAFSALVEQFGFFGGIVVIALFGLLIYSLIKKILKYVREPDEESQSNFLFGVGILSYLFFQMSVNIGMNLGLFPVTGIALPFISYGGSSLVALLIGIALLP